MHQTNGLNRNVFNFERKDMAEKVVRTFNASISEETLSVNIDGENTDVIVQQVISDTESGEVVCNQKIRKTMATEQAWDIIQEASGK